MNLKNQKNTFWIGGKHTVLSAIKGKKRKIIQIVALKDHLDLNDAKVKYQIKQINFFKKIFKSDINHQGIAAEVSGIENIDLKSFIKNKNNIIILDKVNDPINIGLIIRNVLAFNFEGIIITKNDFKTSSQVMTKTSSGAIEFLDICQVSNLHNSIKELKENNFWITGLDSNVGQNIYNFDWPKKNAIIFGSEGYGLRNLTKNNCDYLLKIPMNRNIESLNVASSVASTLGIYNQKLKFNKL